MTHRSAREDIADEEGTFRNARLWDYRPLGDTLDQLQTVRQYYDFVDVDTDRYEVNGETRQVMLSARELAQERTGAASWVNERLTYTHGIGAAMVPVNEVDAGRPAAALDPRPAAGLDVRCPDDHPAADLLRRAAGELRDRRRAPARVRLPGGRHRARQRAVDDDVVDGRRPASASIRR